MSDTVKRRWAQYLYDEDSSLPGRQEVVLASNFDALKARHDALERERDRLRELLRTWRVMVAHDDDCGHLYGLKCDCWLAEIDAALKGGQE